MPGKAASLVPRGVQLTAGPSSFSPHPSAFELCQRSQGNRITLEIHGSPDKTAGSDVSLGFNIHVRTGFQKH
jgi:hypothetical protein